MKVSKTLFLLIIILFRLPSGFAQSKQSKVQVTQITENIYKFFLNAADAYYVNLIAYLSDEGVFLVDSGVEGYTTDVRKALNELGNARIKYIVNTHSDGDHIFGNPQLGREAIIIAHENCREEMKRDERYPDEWLPTITIKDELTIHFGNEVIHLVAMPCHTEDDIIVHFQKSNILCVGDIIFTDSFSTIHVEKNGNPEKLVQVLKDLQTRYSPDTKAIVGHGEDITVADIAKYEKMTTETIAIVRKAMQKNMSAEQMKTGEILKDWRSWESQLFDELNCDLWIQNIVDFYNKKSENKQEGFPVLKGPYLGQEPPGMEPELFAPGIVTTEYHEHSSPVFSPDGSEVFWSVFINFWGPQVILYMQQHDGRWTQPQVAPFSGQYSDGNPCFSPNGQKLFFESRRPVHSGDAYTGETDLWIVERTDEGWGEPNHLGWQVNSQRWERGPSVSNNGNLYFCSMRDGGYGRMDIYRSKFEKGSYSEPENLGNKINTDGYESWPFIAPDESYILFESDAGDIVISFRRNDGSWSETMNMAEKLQSTGSQDRFPRRSNDGKYLFFVSNRWLSNPYFGNKLNLGQVKEKAKSISNGMGNVFWVDAKVIEDMKPENLK